MIFNTKEAQIFLKQTLKNNLPVLLTGAPGVAKTSIIKQVALHLNYKLFISHPVLEDPTDLKGLPFANENRAEWLLYGQTFDIFNCADPAVWLIDDLGQASPSVQAAYMQLLLERSLSGRQLPENIRMIACTNRRKDKAGVTGILEPVKSRFVSIIEVEACIDCWSEWAIGANIHELIIGFLRFRPTFLSDFLPSADLTNTPTPRTWQHASQILQLDLPQSIKERALIGAVGEHAANELLAFERLKDIMPDLRQILSGQLDLERCCAYPLSVLYAICTALVVRSEPEHVNNVMRYAEALSDVNCDMTTVLIKDLIAKHGDHVKNTSVYSQIAAKGILKGF